MPQFQKFEQNTAAYLTPPILKDSFKIIYKMLADNYVLSVLDIGCATGDFLNFLPSGIGGLGIDVSPALVHEANARVRRPNIKFIEADILDLNEKLYKNLKKIDAITILGTLHTFLDFRPLLTCAIKIAPRIIFVHSPFHDSPIDSQHFHKEAGADDYQCAYSIFSKQSIIKYLKNKKVRAFDFSPFEMQNDLVKDDISPLRNHHIKIDTGERYLTNGIGIIFKEYILTIRL